MLWIVTKTHVGLDGAPTLIGAFTAAGRARAACVGVGTYAIFRVTPDKAYADGGLLDVETVAIVSEESLALPQ